MAEIEARLQPPMFFRQVKDDGRRVKVIWVSPDDKPGESEVGASSNIKQLLDEVEHDIMNYQNRGLCYLPKPKAEADNTDTRF